ncbi:MAG: LytR C-terminal domain-containing protein [Actinomycetes bacterium]
MLAVAAVALLVVAVSRTFGVPPASPVAGSTAGGTAPAVGRTPASTPVPSTSRPPAGSAASPAGSQAGPAVIVLNESTRTGLAAHVAARLRASGWDVVGTGNFRGTVAATTVYYPPGQRGPAARLAAAVGAPARLRPVFPGLVADRLTVILTQNFPG